MFLIDCPFCGPRDQREFSCGGEAHIVRPRQPSSLTDDEWADYLFMRKNPKGVQYERWVHAHGCRRWFNVARNTATDRILAVYRMGEGPPALDGQAPPTPCGEPAVGSGNVALGVAVEKAAQPRPPAKAKSPALKAAAKPKSKAGTKGATAADARRPAKAKTEGTAS